MKSRDGISRLSARKTKRDTDAREERALFKFLGRAENPRGNRTAAKIHYPVRHSYEFVSGENGRGEGRKYDNTRLGVIFFVVSAEVDSSYPRRREIMRDLRRYVLLMELKCAKRHVKSDGLYRPETVPARFYRASKRESVACGRSRDKGSRIREPGADTEVALRGARRISLYSVFLSSFFISIAIGIRRRSPKMCSAIINLIFEIIHNR